MFVGVRVSVRMCQGTHRMAEQTCEGDHACVGMTCSSANVVVILACVCVRVRVLMRFGILAQSRSVSVVMFAELLDALPRHHI